RRLRPRPRPRRIRRSGRLRGPPRGREALAHERADERDAHPPPGLHGPPGPPHGVRPGPRAGLGRDPHVRRDGGGAERDPAVRRGRVGGAGRVGGGAGLREAVHLGALARHARAAGRLRGVRGAARGRGPAVGARRRGRPRLGAEVATRARPPPLPGSTRGPTPLGYLPRMEPRPLDPDAPPPPGSLARRTAEARKARQEEKILQEKSFAQRTMDRIRYGQSVLYAFLDQAGALFAFVGAFFARFWRRPFEVRETINQMDEVGSKSFLLTSIVGLSIGVVLAMQSRGTLARFGAESFLPSMLALSVFKEIGPVITSLVLAGRLGAGIAAELGSMKVTEQIDALEV